MKPLCLVLAFSSPVFAAELTSTAPIIAEKEMGIRLGTQFSADDVTPGGLRVGGLFLQRMSQRSWFDGEASFSFGANEAGCESQNGTFSCPHGLTDGFGMQLSLGGRYVFDALLGGLQPYARGGVGVHLARFGADDLTGAAFPLWAGGGGRFRVADGVSLAGEALVFAGPSVFNRDLGAEPYVGMLIQVGVEFQLE